MAVFSLLTGIRMDGFWPPMEEARRHGTGQSQREMACRRLTQGEMAWQKLQEVCCSVWEASGVARVLAVAWGAGEAEGCGAGPMFVGDIVLGWGGVGVRSGMGGGGVEDVKPTLSLTGLDPAALLFNRLWERGSLGQPVSARWLGNRGGRGSTGGVRCVQGVRGGRRCKSGGGFERGVVRGWPGRTGPALGALDGALADVGRLGFISSGGGGRVKGVSVWKVDVDAWGMGIEVDEWWVEVEISGPAEGTRGVCAGGAVWEFVTSRREWKVLMEEPVSFLWYLILAHLIALSAATGWKGPRPVCIATERVS